MKECQKLLRSIKLQIAIPPTLPRLPIRHQPHIPNPHGSQSLHTHVPRLQHPFELVSQIVRSAQIERKRAKEGRVRRYGWKIVFAGWLRCVFLGGGIVVVVVVAVVVVAAPHLIDGTDVADIGDIGGEEHGFGIDILVVVTGEPLFSQEGFRFVRVGGGGGAGRGSSGAFVARDGAEGRPAVVVIIVGVSVAAAFTERCAAGVVRRSVHSHDGSILTATPTKQLLPIGIPGDGSMFNLAGPMSLWSR
mmetsp:Transcript_29839/g.62857  ORF Transcript_29839/g.62857 Transcript_29839/m.62857 type:complete len:247 (-) Transcript_29839:277-1017(-)